MKSLEALIAVTPFCPKCGKVMDAENLGCMVGYAYWCKKHGVQEPRFGRKKWA